MMTREKILAHIADNHAEVAADCGIATADEPKALKYVIDETLAWLGDSDDEDEMAGLANYFAYCLFHAKLVTNGLVPSASFNAAMAEAAAECENAGFDFGGEDN